jgi:6-phosphogluconate dehydrogenase
VANLERPRKVFLLVKTGAAVDAFIGMIIPHLLNSCAIQLFDK